MLKVDRPRKRICTFYNTKIIFFNYYYIILDIALGEEIGSDYSKVNIIIKYR